MKLTNPTDWQLNSNFAVEVAGWSWKIEGDNCVCWYNEDGCFMGGRNDGEPWDGIPKFTQSADLVLPWLEKWHDSGRGPVLMGTIHSAAMQRTGWMVQVRDADLSKNAPRDFEIISWSLPYAAVVALLNAHGVEIEFT